MSRACKTNCGVTRSSRWRYKRPEAERSGSLHPSALSFIALAMQRRRRSGVAAQMVFRDIVSSYLTSLARVTVQTRLRITRMKVRMVRSETHETETEGGDEEEEEEDEDEDEDEERPRGSRFSSGGTSSAT